MVTIKDVIHGYSLEDWADAIAIRISDEGVDILDSAKDDPEIYQNVLILLEGSLGSDYQSMLSDPNLRGVVFVGVYQQLVANPGNIEQFIGTYVIEEDYSDDLN